MSKILFDSKLEIKEKGRLTHTHAWVIEDKLHSVPYVIIVGNSSSATVLSIGEIFGICRECLVRLIKKFKLEPSKTIFLITDGSNYKQVLFKWVENTPIDIRLKKDKKMTS